MSTANRALAGAFRYLATSSTQTSFSLTAARLADAAPNPYTNANAAHRVVGMAAHRGISITPFGAGADDTTFDLKVWRVLRGLGANRQPDDWELSLFGFATCTLSTAVGVAGGLVSASERLADTVVWTTATGASTHKGDGSTLETAFGTGTATAYSPANNTPGRIVIPDVFDAWGVLVEFDLTGATGANALLEQTR